MTDDVVQGWAPVYPHLRYHEPGEAIAWLTRVFGFRERVRKARPDGTVITAKLEGPGGGLVMVAGSSPEFQCNRLAANHIQWQRCAGRCARRGARLRRPPSLRPELPGEEVNPAA